MSFLILYIAIFEHVNTNNVWVTVMKLYTTFSNISFISWWSVLKVADTGVLDENHRMAANKGNNKLTEQQCSEGKGKTHKSTNRQHQSTTGKLGKP